MSTLQESPESSSPIITKAVAAGLAGETAENYNFPDWQKSILLKLGMLPQIFGRTVISNFQAISGIPGEELSSFSIDDLIKNRIDDYKLSKSQFPVITVGTGAGGATTYLSLALNAPFLPQAFVLTLKGGSYRGNANDYLQRTINLAHEITNKDKNLVTIQHYDPVHDGWLTRFVNHIRFKLINLPASYAEFIKAHLTKNGTVVFLDGGARWMRYKVGPRNYFQVGGWGDIPSEEFLTGSPRLEHYAKITGLQHDKWGLDTDQYPLEIGPESEWGSEPGLAETLEIFCQSEGYNFVRITCPEPYDFSKLAYAAAELMLKKDGRQPSGVFVECFSQFDASSALQSGLLPLWLVFNTTDGARFLKERAKTFPQGIPVFFSPLSTFSLTPDIAPWSDWEDALSSNFINIGARKSHYPADTKALITWAEPLRAWVKANYAPIQSRLSALELADLALQIIHPA